MIFYKFNRRLGVKKLIIAEPDVLEIIRYLQSKPMNEVENLVNFLRRLEAMPAPVAEPIDTDKPHQ